MNLTFISGCQQPRGVAVDRSHIYWANDGNSIGQADLDGQNVNQQLHPQLPQPIRDRGGPRVSQVSLSSAAVSGLLAAAFDVPVSLHSESGDGLWPHSVSCAVRHAAVFRRSLAKGRKLYGKGG